MGTTTAGRMATALAVVMLVIGAGCGDDEPAATIRSEPVPGVETADAASGNSVSSDGSGNRSEGVGETGSDRATTMGEPFTSQPGPMTNEGMPSTFIAVTDDSFELVEIDTVDGRVVRSLGSTGDGADDFGNVIDGAWWHPASGIIIVSDGPEPAAGNLTLLEPGQEYERRGGPDGWGMGWDVALSPDGRFALVTGYEVDISLVAGGTNGRNVVVSLAEASGQFFRTHPAWLRDRIGVAMARQVDGGGTVLDVVELDGDGQVTSTVTHELGRAITDLEVRADGKLVVLYADDDGRNPLAGGRQAVIIDADSGRIEAEFTLEPGSHSLAYDATGTFLLYVDGEGTVRWRGAGSSGVLADGYFHADW